MHGCVFNVNNVDLVDKVFAIMLIITIIKSQYKIEYVRSWWNAIMISQKTVNDIAKKIKMVTTIA